MPAVHQALQYLHDRGVIALEQARAERRIEQWRGGFKSRLRILLQVPVQQPQTVSEQQGEHRDLHEDAHQDDFRPERMAQLDAVDSHISVLLGKHLGVWIKAAHGRAIHQAKTLQSGRGKIGFALWCRPERQQCLAQLVHIPLWHTLVRH